MRIICYNDVNHDLQKLSAATDLVPTSDCRDLFPLPEAVQSLVPDKILRFAAEYTPTCHFSPLNRSLLLGHGGYGIVFRHLLNGQEYAVKWVSQFMTLHGNKRFI